MEVENFVVVYCNIRSSRCFILKIKKLHVSLVELTQIQWKAQANEKKYSLCLVSFHRSTDFILHLELSVVDNFHFVVEYTQ